MRFALSARSLLGLLVLAFLLTSCALLAPQPGSSPGTTEPSSPDGSLSALRALLTDASPTQVKCSILCEDPAVGSPLAAETVLAYANGSGTLSYRYDKPNPIGAGSFSSVVSGSASGDLQALSAALSGAASWVWDASVGVSLPSIRLEHANLATVSIDEIDGAYLLTATPTEGKVGNLVGESLAEAKSLSLQIGFTKDAVTLVRLDYTLGEVKYTVLASFTYPNE